MFISFPTKQQVISQYKDLTRRHKVLTSQHYYLTKGGMPLTMPPYKTQK